MRKGRNDKAGTIYRRADCRYYREAGSGAKTAGLARKLGVSEDNALQLNSYFGRLGKSGAKRLRALDYKNAKLERC